MPLHDSSAAQQARRSLADNVALGRRQDEGSNLETLVFTTTVALQMVVPSAVSIDGTSSNFQTIVPVTEVITSSVLVSPMTTSAVSASPSSTASSSTASSIPTTSSASTLPSSANLQTTPTTSGGFSALPSQSGNVIAAAGGAPTASSSSVPSDSRPFPTGAIAALVIAGFMFVNILCVYLYRRHSLAKRNRRRATWKAGIRASSSDFLNVEKGGSSEPRPPMPIPFTLGMPGTNGRSPSNGSMRSSVYNLPSALERTFPRDSFSPSRSISDARRASPPARPARSVRRPTGDGSPPMPSNDPTPRVSAAMSTSSTRVPTAIVRVTFIPTRTDELSISIGQTLAVLHTFDDGWALCANESGERGMVPLECLEGGGGQFAGYRDRSAMMQSSSRRASSLYPGSPATR